MVESFIDKILNLTILFSISIAPASASSLAPFLLGCAIAMVGVAILALKAPTIIVETSHAIRSSIIQKFVLNDSAPPGEIIANNTQKVNSTNDHAQHQYAITTDGRFIHDYLTDEPNETNEQKLLGLPRNRTWLLGSKRAYQNYAHKSLLPLQTNDHRLTQSLYTPALHLVDGINNFSTPYGVGTPKNQINKMLSQQLPSLVKRPSTTTGVKSTSSFHAWVSTISSPNRPSSAPSKNKTTSFLL